MKIYKVLPDLSNERQMKIWHKALRAQWSAEDLDWTRPGGVRRDDLRDDLARILTPVLMGEQSALYSVSGLIPVLGQRSEVPGQFYLTTWAVDEARHTELFARFYGRLEREPLSIRRFPAGYLFQSRIVSDEPAEWLSGVLVSECLALKLMHVFRDLSLDPVLDDICDGILLDESRHLGFNHLYLEDRFAGLFAEGGEEGERLARRLAERTEWVLAGVPPMLDALAVELERVGIDRERLFADVREEVARRLAKSISAGRRVAGRAAAAAEG